MDAKCFADRVQAVHHHQLHWSQLAAFCQSLPATNSLLKLYGEAQSIIERT